MAVSKRPLVLAALLLSCLLGAECTVCPEDSVLGDDGNCRCVSHCPKRQCQAGQQPVRVEEANPGSPGSCCPLYECQEQVTLNWIQEEGASVQCVDDIGKVYNNGERWQEKADPCMSCVCELGNKSCQMTMCRSCLHPEPLQQGECCPRCPSLPNEYQCPPLRDCDLECERGHELDAHGCSVCRCRSADKQEEPEEDAEDVKEGPRGCPRLDCRLSCEHGLLLDETGCSVCRCRPHPDCPKSLDCPKKCPQGYRTDELGCPSCRCRGCLDAQNVTRPEGTSWSVEPCRSCVCELSGQISCNETVCSVACAEPLPPPPGRCCPLCPPVSAMDEWRGWGTIPIVLIVVLAVLCVLLMVHLVRSRFRARMAPSAVFSQQYYKNVPAYDTHLPVLRYAEKIAPI